MNRFLRAVAAPIAALAVAAFVQSSDAAEIQGKKISLPSSERQVTVIQFKAPGTAPRPSVLMLHGAGGFDRQLANNERYAAQLAAQGFDAYMVYYYSDRDDQLMSHGVDVFEQRYRDWAKTVGELAEYLEKQKDSNGKAGLVGFSNGGILSTGASTLNPKINAAVIYYGTDPWPLGTRAKRFPPMLILHGDADQVIPVDAGKELAAEAKSLGGAADLVIYPGESHGFCARWDDKNATDAFNRAVAFLKKELK